MKYTTRVDLSSLRAIDDGESEASLFFMNNVYRVYHDPSSGSMVLVFNNETSVIVSYGEVSDIGIRLFVDYFLLDMDGGYEHLDTPTTKLSLDRLIYYLQKVSR